MTLLLAGTNLLTKDMIKEQELKTEETARKVVLPQPTALRQRMGIFSCPQGRGNSLGYIFTTEADSYGGALKVMTGISEAGKVTGVSILSIDDTPGLGMNAKNEVFAAGICRTSGRRLRGGNRRPGPARGKSTPLRVPPLPTRP